MEIDETTGAKDVLPLNITIDNIDPYITDPPAGNYDVDAQSFTLTIEFSEALNLTADNAPILTETDIILKNADYLHSGTFAINNNGNDGKGRIVAEATKYADLPAKHRPTITINGEFIQRYTGKYRKRLVTYSILLLSEVQIVALLTAGILPKILF